MDDIKINIRKNRRDVKAVDFTFKDINHYGVLHSMFELKNTLYEILNRFNSPNNNDEFKHYICIYYSYEEDRCANVCTVHAHFTGVNQLKEI